MNRTALIMAAGTGGHIYPGLAIADVLAARGWAIVWLGTPAGMEHKLVGQAGYPIEVVQMALFISFLEHSNRNLAVGSAARHCIERELSVRVEHRRVGEFKEFAIHGQSAVMRRGASGSEQLGLD